MTLNQIGLQHGTDKCSDGKGFGHGYCDIYERYLGHLKNEKLVILEIGIGGEEHIDRGGQSLRMWHDYFPQALIAGVDLYEKNLPPQARIHIYKGSQIDGDLLGKVVDDIGAPDIIIDDASHHNAFTPQTFNILWPRLKPGGFYIVEDVHTSYWRENYGGNPDPAAAGTTMAYFTALTHQLNHPVLEGRYKWPAYDGLEYVHFYPELIILKKR